jgi:hypothetical protein
MSLDRIEVNAGVDRLLELLGAVSALVSDPAGTKQRLEELGCATAAAVLTAWSAKNRSCAATARRVRSKTNFSV